MLIDTTRLVLGPLDAFMLSILCNYGRRKRSRGPYLTIKEDVEYHQVGSASTDSPSKRRCEDVKEHANRPRLGYPGFDVHMYI